jgi:phage/plasmid-associated DNA primase
VQTLTRLAPSTFRARFAARYYDRHKTWAEAWWEWPGRRQYERTTLVADPREPLPDDTLNLWRGWGVKPNPFGKCERILAHLLNVVCAGNPVHYQYLLGWLACVVQRYDRPGEVATILRGGEGVGKSAVGTLMRRLMGHHGVLLSQPSQIVGKFNAALEGAIFVEASESLYAGDPRAAGPLKSLVTDDIISIERKGKDVYQSRNRVHLLMTSNEEWVVPAGAESRRWFVLDVDDKRRGDRDYFARLFAEINDDASLGAFLHLLQQRDLSRFDVRQVPATDALFDQRARSMKGVLAWALDLAERGNIEAKRGTMPWATFATTTDLHHDYTDWRRERPHERYYSLEVFAGELRRTLGLHQQRPMVNGVRSARGYELPATAEELGKLVRVKAGLVNNRNDGKEEVAA